MADEIVSDVPLPPTLQVVTRELDRQFCDLLLWRLAGPRQTLDGFPVRIARIEVHPRIDERGILAEDGFDTTRPFEERLPVKLLQNTQVAYGPLHSDLGRRPRGRRGLAS